VLDKFSKNLLEKKGIKSPLILKPYHHLVSLREKRDQQEKDKQLQRIIDISRL
jgi:hypothetical protein